MMNDPQITLTPATPQTMQREFRWLEIVAVVVLVVGFFSVASGVYESLRTAFPRHTAIAMAIALSLSIDLAFAMLFFAGINLFAHGRMEKSAWNMYFACAVALVLIVLFIGNIVIENVHAVAAKTRGFKNAVDYTADPLLLNAQYQRREIDSTLKAIDLAMSDIGKSMRQAGTAASAFSNSATDTSLSGKQRSNQLWGAMKANNTQANLGAQLTRLNDQRSKVLSAKLNASFRVDSLLALLKKENALRSPEDVIEARLGINFLGNISMAEIVIKFLGVLALFILPIMSTGKAYYNPFVFMPANDTAPPTTSDGGTGVASPYNDATPSLALPEPLKHPFADMDAAAACDWAEFLLLTDQYVGTKHPKYDSKTGGSYSAIIHRIGGRHHVNKGHLDRRVKKVKQWLLTAPDEKIHGRIKELVERHNWQEYSVTPSVAPFLNAVTPTNGKLHYANEEI